MSFLVRLTPKGGRDRLDGWTAGADGIRYLKARVAAPPDAGKANASLLALLARELRVPKSAVAVASGQTSRLKTIAVEGDAVGLVTKLQDLGQAK